MSFRLTVSTPDDWVFVFQCRSALTGREYQRVLGVNGWLEYDAALRLATKHVRPARAKMEGRAPDIIDVRSTRYHLWIESGKKDLRNTSEIVDTMKL